MVKKNWWWPAGLVVALGLVVAIYAPLTPTAEADHINEHGTLRCEAKEASNGTRWFNCEDGNEVIHAGGTFLAPEKLREYSQDVRDELLLLDCGGTYLEIIETLKGNPGNDLDDLDLSDRDEIKYPVCRGEDTTLSNDYADNLFGNELSLVKDTNASGQHLCLAQDFPGGKPSG